jgi:hypothetical protein
VPLRFLSIIRTNPTGEFSGDPKYDSTAVAGLSQRLTSPPSIYGARRSPGAAFFFKERAVFDLKQDAGRQFALYFVWGAVRKGAPCPGGPNRAALPLWKGPPLSSPIHPCCTFVTKDVGGTGPLWRSASEAAPSWKMQQFEIFHAG